MERTNMSITTIRDLARDGKPLYLETTLHTDDGYDVPKRYRIYGVRVSKGGFQVKVARDGKTKWYSASAKQVVCAY